MPSGTAIISFYDPISPRTPKDYHKVNYCGVCDNVFYVGIHDIDIEILEDYGLTYDTYFPEAAELADFIVESIEKHHTIICQCEYGQSRSAACAAAIKEFYDKSGMGWRYGLSVKKAHVGFHRYCNQEGSKIMIILTILSVLWIAWSLGKEDGKWGLLIFLGILFLVGFIATAFK